MAKRWVVTVSVALLLGVGGGVYIWLFPQASLDVVHSTSNVSMRSKSVESDPNEAELAAVAKNALRAELDDRLAEVVKGEKKRETTISSEEALARANKILAEVRSRGKLTKADMDRIFDFHRQMNDKELELSIRQLQDVLKAPGVVDSSAP